MASYEGGLAPAARISVSRDPAYEADRPARTAAAAQYCWAGQAEGNPLPRAARSSALSGGAGTAASEALRRDSAGTARAAVRGLELLALVGACGSSRAQWVSSEAGRGLSG